MEVFTDKGKTVFPLTEIRQLVPEACSYCIDMTAEFSDISVGVVEGRTDMNTLIIRTDRGRELVEEAVLAEYLVLSDAPGEKLEHLRWAAGNKKKRGLAKAKEKTIINKPAGTGISYLRINDETLSTICP
jgi:coenzyme F420 hydrogenase subunit beta